MLASMVAGRVFDPRRLGSLEAWWDASDASTVTLDSGRVSTWVDKSGNGRNATNSTSGTTQPSYSATQNGLNVISFASASSQRLSVASSSAMFNFVHNGTASIIYAVATFGTSSDPNAIMFLLANSSADAGTNAGFQYGFDDRSGVRNNGLFWSVGNGTAPVDYITTANLITPNTYSVFEMRSAATSTPRASFAVNGGTATNATNGSGTATTNNAAGNLFIGAQNPAKYYLNGTVAEILMFSSDLTAAGRQAIRFYLGNKWGIATS